MDGGGLRASDARGDVASSTQPSPPTIKDTIRCWFSRVGSSSPTFRPRRMTTARSAMSMTWSSACEIDDHGVVRGPQADDEVQDAARLPDAECRGRLVEDHHVRGERRRPSDGHRLTLPAGHQPDRVRHVRHPDLEPLDQLAGVAPHRRAIEQAQPGGQPARSRRARARRRSSRRDRGCRTVRDPGRRSRSRAPEPGPATGWRSLGHPSR